MTRPTKTATPTTRANSIFETRGIEAANTHLIENIKFAAAFLWDEIDTIPVPPGNTETLRLIATAKTSLETAVMQATKGISRLTLSKEM